MRSHQNLTCSYSHSHLPVHASIRAPLPRGTSPCWTDPSAASARIDRHQGSGVLSGAEASHSFGSARLVQLGGIEPSSPTRSTRGALPLSYNKHKAPIDTTGWYKPSCHMRVQWCPQGIFQRAGHAIQKRSADNILGPVIAHDRTTGSTDFVLELLRDNNTHIFRLLIRSNSCKFCEVIGAIRRSRKPSSLA